MKIVVALLFCTIQCLWASYLPGQSRTQLKTMQNKVMDIVEKFKKNGFPSHGFFSNAKIPQNANISTIVNHHITNDTEVEKKHIQILNHMVHGLVDILENTTGPLLMSLNRLHFSEITAKKYKQDWDHSKRFTAHCKTKINVDLKYIVAYHNIKHIDNCIAQGVLRIYKEPNNYLNQFFEAIKKTGICRKNSPHVECKIENQYSITEDLGNYTYLFETGPKLGLVPLQNIIAEKNMSLDCVDDKLQPMSIKYDTFQTCTAKEKGKDNLFA